MPNQTKTADYILLYPFSAERHLKFSVMYVMIYHIENKGGFPVMMDTPRQKSFAVQKAERKNDSLFLYSERGVLRISPKSESVIRISYAEETDTIPGVKGLGVSYDEPYKDWTLTETEDEYIIKLPKVTAKLNKMTESIKYYDAAGTLLLCEADKESKRVEYYDSYKYIIDDSCEFTYEEYEAGKYKDAVPKKVFDRKLCKTRINLRFTEDEKIFGLGQMEDGILNVREETRYLHQANLRVAIPFFLSTNGWGILSATGGCAIFTDGHDGTYFNTDADEMLDFYFIVGPEFDEIISGYRLITGKARLLPKWTFGFIQSQERFESQKEILSVAEEFKKRGIGVDCIVLDWLSWDPKYWAQKSFDKSRFPDVPGMIKKLEDDNIHFMISIWPGMGKSCPDAMEFAEKNQLLPFTGNYDAFNPEARATYWNQVRNNLWSQGIRSFWADSTEPITPEMDRPIKPAPAEMYREYIDIISQSIERDKLNAYVLPHMMMLYEGQRAETDKARVCTLTRSAFPGIQRYGTLTWSGDTSATWDVFKNQIIGGLNFCASGFPFWTLDIGAFFVKKGEFWSWHGDYTEDDLGYTELFVRWFQLGAFLPVFRSHGTAVRREIWNRAKEGDMFYQAMTDAVKLRYSLIPYIYSAAADAALNDGTMMRMLAFDFRKDKKATSVCDQFMFGKSLMVCPVTEPMYYGPNSEKLENTKKTRTVYLPEGCSWYDMRTNEKYGGGQSIEVDADISSIPVFVRAGSIIPTTEPVQHTSETAKKRITLTVYPGADAEFALYEDSGDGYAYENGEYTWKIFKWNDAKKTLSGDTEDIDIVIK